MSKPPDVELLNDLRSLGKPPTFGGTDAEYQDVRFPLAVAKKSEEADLAP